MDSIQPTTTTSSEDYEQLELDLTYDIEGDEQLKLDLTYDS